MYIQYGTGACVLRLGQDTVQMGSIAVHNQSIGMAVKESTMPFSELPFDGLVGLGFPEQGGNNDEMRPIVDNMKLQKTLKQNMFSFYFSDSTSKPGAISFGAIDPRYIFPGDEPAMIPLISTDYWEIAIHGIAVGDNDLDLCSKKRCRAAVDTGSSLITAPSAVVMPLLAELNIADDCSNKDTLSNLTFVLKDMDKRRIELNLEPADYVLEEVDEHGTKHCAAGFIPMDIPAPRGPLFVLGNNLIRKYYTIFDRDNMAVGFMKANHGHEIEQFSSSATGMWASTFHAFVIACAATMVSFA
eukprot:Selendium_serpulae@DN5437_c0_g1_i2.p2